MMSLARKNKPQFASKPSTPQYHHVRHNDCKKDPPAELQTHKAADAILLIFSREREQ